MAIVHTSSQAEPQALRFQQPKLINTEKPKNRPQALQLAPFDAGELSRRLSVVVAGQDDDEVDPMSMVPPKSAKESPRNYQLKKDRSMSFNDSASPRSVPRKEPSPKGLAPKLSARKDSTSEAPVRRGSIFDRFNWKGSNFKEEEEQQKKPPAQPAYRHVPKHAASQFARTTTVETVSQKVTQVPKSAVSSASLGNPPISPMEYNNMYRRAHSLCSGRPYDRNGQFGVRETIAEVDEESSQPKNRQNGRGLTVNEPGGLRRKSTGTMNSAYSRADVNIAMNQLRRDSTGMGSYPRRDSAGMSAYQRRDSQGSGGVRRDSASSNRSNRSNPFKDPPSNGTPKRRESDRGDTGPLSPFKQEFDGVDQLRRGSDAITNSRRGSEQRVDWSQSDEPAKKEARGESKWNIKGRLGSISQRNIQDKEGKQELLVPNDTSPPMLSPRSPKSGSGFLSKFKRQ